MAIIDMPTRRGARAVAIRHGDRFALPPVATSSERGGSVTAIVVATAMIAGCVASLFLYDMQRPLAYGAALTAPTPSLAISVAPMPADAAR